MQVTGLRVVTAVDAGVSPLVRQQEGNAWGLPRCLALFPFPTEAWAGSDFEVHLGDRRWGGGFSGSGRTGL